jgi:hypothetical protein
MGALNKGSRWATAILRGIIITSRILLLPQLLTKMQEALAGMVLS